MKKIIASLCAACLLVGCAVAAKSSEESGEQGDSVQTLSEDTEEEAFQELFDIRAEGIDYLSVEGIELPPGVNVAMVGKDPGSDYWKEVKKGAEQAVQDINKALGYTGEEEIELTYDAPSDEDIAEQIDIIDQMLDKSPDALIISFVDVNSGSTQLELAESNGVPVLSVDSSVENSLIVSEIKTDNYQAGAETARQLAALIGDSGQIALLIHSSETETGIERERGFTEENRQNHPDIEIVNVAYQDQDERSTDDIVASVLSEYPALKAYQAMNEDTTQALLSALSMYAPEDRELIVTGFDASQKEAEAIEEGSLAGTVAQNPYGMGYAAAVAALRSVAGMENAPVIDTGYTWISADELSKPSAQLLIY